MSDQANEPASSVGADRHRGPSAASGSRFVVQHHRATRLHYDLRLEVDGVLASWAVPKGPTLDPGVPRLAVRVDDHALDYFDFEEPTPMGRPGGGDVIVWDWGTWSLVDGTNALDAITRGEVHLELRGEKLNGRFALVRRGASERQWLLIHKADESAVKGWDPDDHPRSVKSGRVLATRRDAAR